MEILTSHQMMEPVAFIDSPPCMVNAAFPADLVLFNCDNDVFTMSRQKYKVGDDNKRMYRMKEWRIMTSKITSIMFWGGRLFDCGEYELSSLLIERSNHLQYLSCFPAAGVHMVRPLYCRNNRAGKFLFPRLEVITMMDCGTPYDFGLITPNLRKIEIILSNYNGEAEIREWMNLEKARKLFSENKKLEEIFVVRADPADNEMKRVPVLYIRTPYFNLWEKRKLVLLAMFREQVSICPLAGLQYDMLRSICAMVSGSWTIVKQNTDGEVLETVLVD